MKPSRKRQGVGGGVVLVPKGQQLKVHRHPVVMRKHAAVAAVARRGAAAVAVDCSKGVH